MRLCVGAVSPRVVEVAAQLNVYQIVASRGQVDVGGGYTGLDQRGLVELVRKFSADTEIIRDHGGPAQGGHADDGTASFAADIEAGFTGLHIDVCKVKHSEQRQTLRELLTIYGQKPGISIEIGGERDPWEWNRTLLDLAIAIGCTPSYVVAQAHSLVSVDRQVGQPNPSLLWRQALYALERGVKLKAHNMDWVTDTQFEFDEYLDAYNIAPELGVLETNAVLTVLPWTAVSELLELGYASRLWRRWFADPSVGTDDERARCGIRYMQRDPRVIELTTLDLEGEDYVRTVIRDAIVSR